MANVKVKRLTPRSGVHTVPYLYLRPKTAADGDFVFDEKGAHVMEEYVREQEEGFAQNVGDEIDVDAAEGGRLIEDGQAELASTAAPRKRQPRTPKAEKAEAPAKGESRAKRAAGKVAARVAKK